MGFGATVLWVHALPLSPLSHEDTPNGVLSLVPLRESIELTIPVLSGGGLLPQLIVVWDWEPVLSSIYWFPLHLDQSKEEGDGVAPRDWRERRKSFYFTKKKKKKNASWSSTRGSNFFIISWWLMIYQFSAAFGCAASEVWDFWK